MDLCVGDFFGVCIFFDVGFDGEFGGEEGEFVDVFVCDVGVEVGWNDVVDICGGGSVDKW